MDALQEKNRNKNKDLQIVPYDCSRVILTQMEGMGADDYINAGYIDGYDRSKAYIATQGPKFFTITDFWRMINFIEGKKRKCAEYFPQKVNTVFECGQMSVKLVHEVIYEYYEYRKFELFYKHYIRKVQHLKLKWNPSDSIPLYPNYLTSLVKRISHIREKSTTPIVIHCSSGVNRTGTLILCDLALQMAKIEKYLDFYTLARNMRQQSPNMISSEKQYILAHLVVLECLMEEENIFKMNLAENFHSSVLKSQLKYLDTLGTHDEIVKSWIPHYNQFYESSYSQVLVDGYAKNRKFIVIKQPNQDCQDQFWDVVVKNKVQVILSLNKTSHQIWPYIRQNPRTVVRVEQLNSTNTDYYTTTKLSLQITRLPRNHVILEHRFDYFQLHFFDHNLKLKSVEGLLTLLDDVCKNNSATRPILVACRDGLTTSGLYVALSYIIDKYRSEVEVDVCGAVRTIRRSGTKFIKNKMQLKFLYNATMEYLEKFDSYKSVS